MKVQQDPIFMERTTADQATTVREGGVYKATVIEKTDGNETKVRINQQEVQVIIEGKQPQSGPVTLQITDATSEPMHAKVVAEQSHQTPQVSPELRDVLQQIQKQGRTISKEEWMTVKKYLEQGSGTKAERLETVKQMIQKAIPLTETNIRAIHETLHGEKLGEILQQINPNVPKPTEEQLKGEVQIDAIDKEVMRPAQNSHLFSEVLKKIRTTLDFPALIQSIGETQWPSKIGESLAERIKQAEQLYAAGKEMAARQVLAQFIDAQQPQAQQMVSETETAYQIQGSYLEGIPSHSRQMVITTITDKLAIATHEFKQTQKEIGWQLRQTEQIIKQAPMQARPSLEQMIHKLDQTILKSDFMLYTTMETEKQLLQASNQLHDARKLLSKGDTAQAQTIVQNVRKLVEQLEFKPADVRIKHMIAKEWSQLQQLPPAKQVTQTVADAHHALKQEPTARQALEWFRASGLLHESDVTQKLTTDRPLDENLKQALLKLAQTSGSQRADQALQQITGQQLLAKADGQGLQTLVLALPIMLQNTVDDVKIFVQANQKNEKIDWENCSLYFLLETKKFGDVGILLKSVDRHLAITVKNDQLHVKNQLQPLIEQSKVRLEEIGYQMSSLKFTQLTEKQAETKQPIKKQPTLNESGYDFSI